MFTVGLVSDLIKSNEPVELALVDIDPAALGVASRLVQKMVDARNAPIRVRSSLDRKDVLKDASVVITTIGVGGRRAWEQDVLIPRKYGIYMPVGDTVGPGGTSRAMRMIPPMIEIARDVLDLAPDALFINYANPMSVICRAVRKVTGAEVIGLCIGSWDTVLYLAKTLGVMPHELSYNAGGINHLTWFSEVVCRGQDGMPVLREHARRVVQGAEQAVKDYMAGKRPELPHCGSPFESSYQHPFSWQCLLWFDAFPAPLDRHVTEFFPQFFREGKYYGKKLGIDEFSFEGTIEAGDRGFAQMQSDAHDPNPLVDSYFDKLSGEQEQAIDIVQSIRHNKGKVYFANLPNQGQVPNLPLGAVIEAPAIANSRGLHAIQQRPLPTAAAGILATRFAWVETLVEAYVHNSRDKFIQALILDGAVSSVDTAVQLADELIAAHKPFLGAL